MRISTILGALALTLVASMSTTRSAEAASAITGKGADGRRHKCWRESWYVWNNDGDIATLKNKSRRRVDRCDDSGAGSTAGC